MALKMALKKRFSHVIIEGDVEEVMEEPVDPTKNVSWPAGN